MARKRVTAQWRNRAMTVAPYFTLCTTQDLFLEVCKNLKVDPGASWAPKSGARTHHYYNDDGDCVCIVCITGDDTAEPIDIAALLVHEAVHVFQRWCDEYGEKSPSSEFQAYSIQWISAELMREYVRQTKERT